WSSRCRNRARPVFDRIPRAGPDSPPGAATTTIRPIRPLRSSPMVDPVRSPQHAPRDLPTELPAALDPAKEARELLEVGSRWGRDDYDARATAFAEAIRQGDADYQQALVAELLGQDSNAFNSWMTPARINSLVDSGQISLTERGAMAEAIAGAFNNGQLPGHEVRNASGEVVAQGSALDTFLYSGTAG